jgi:hypothetical protein
MFISQKYSHRGAFEEIKDTKEWKEITDSIQAVKLVDHKNKISKEKNRDGEMLISPSSVNEAMAKELEYREWFKKRRTFWLSENV